MKNSSQNLLEAITLVDRISNLPDDILCHILSFLKTKQAVATSILSKRWEFLWIYVDTLELSNFGRPNYLTFEKKMQYMKFVRRVLELHRAPLIKRMELICFGLVNTDCNDRDYVTWIQTALSSKNVQCLHLHFSNRDHNRWLLCFFYSKTLVEPKLTDANIIDVMDSPFRPLFPNLKKLRLHQTRINIDSVDRFISGCSIVEDIYLDCYFPHVSKEPCYISSTSLKTLELRCIVKKLVLNTPALKLLKVRETLIYCELLVESSMPSLDEAHISICLDGLDNFGFLKFLSNVSVLSLEVEGNRHPVKLDLPVHFHNLTKLKIKSPPHIGLELLTFFIQKSNNLQVITMEETIDDEESGVIWEEPLHVPKCLSSSLQTIRIQGYTDEEEVELMIKYVLANAEVLKSMKIFGKTDNECRLILQKILMFHRASVSCKISVHIPVY